MHKEYLFYCLLSILANAFIIRRMLTRLIRQLSFLSKEVFRVSANYPITPLNELPLPVAEAPVKWTRPGEKTKVDHMHRMAIRRDFTDYSSAIPSFNYLCNHKLITIYSSWLLDYYPPVLMHHN